MKIKNCEIDGKCSRCGNCCSASMLPVTRQEADMIHYFILKNNIKRAGREWSIEFLETEKMQKKIDLRCCFFTGTECSIYPVRPSICRTFRCGIRQNKIEKNRERHHRIAYFNDSAGSNLTNFDLLFYGDPVPLQVFLLKVAKLDDLQMNQILEKKLCKYSYKIEKLKTKL